MVKIIGKVCIVLSFFFSQLYGSKSPITVKICDTQHRPIKTIGVGVPFIIKTTFKGDIHNLQHPIFKGLPSINGTLIGCNEMSVNGKTSVTYTYRAYSNKKGEQVVGPIEINGYSSQPLTLLVTDVAQKVDKKKSGEEEIIVRMSLDSATAMVGEKITCRMRLLTKNSGRLRIHNVGQEPNSDLVQVDMQKPTMGTEIIQGKEYTYTDWVKTFVAQKAGEHIFNPLYIDYIQTKKSHSSWNNFAQFFATPEIKRVYSNAQKVMVRSFDDAPYPVCAIGTDVTINASIDNAVIAQSEAAVLRIEVTGAEGVTFRPIQELSAVPDQLKAFQSKTKEQDTTHYYTEFIIQGLKAGEYEIPSQYLCYFDTSLHTYQTVTTQPISLLIKEAPIKHQNKNLKKRDVETPKIVTAEKNEPLLPLCMSSTSCAQSTQPLPFFVFILILVCIALLGCAQKIIKKITYLINNFVYNPYNNAFKHALLSIQKAQKNGDQKKLHAIFTQLFATRLSVPLHEITADRIEYELYNRFVKDEVRAEWNNFFIRVQTASFGQTPMTTELLSESVEWVNALKKIV